MRKLRVFSLAVDAEVDGGSGTRLCAAIDGGDP